MAPTEPTMLAGPHGIEPLEPVVSPRARCLSWRTCQARASSAGWPSVARWRAMDVGSACSPACSRACGIPVWRGLGRPTVSPRWKLQAAAPHRDRCGVGSLWRWIAAGVRAPRAGGPCVCKPTLATICSPASMRGPCLLLSSPVCRCRMLIHSVVMCRLEVNSPTHKVVAPLSCAEMHLCETMRPRATSEMHPVRRGTRWTKPRRLCAWKAGASLRVSRKLLCHVHLASHYAPCALCCCTPKSLRPVSHQIPLRTSGPFFRRPAKQLSRAGARQTYPTHARARPHGIRGARPCCRRLAPEMIRAHGDPRLRAARVLERACAHITRARAHHDGNADPRGGVPLHRLFVPLARLAGAPATDAALERERRAGARIAPVQRRR